MDERFIHRSCSTREISEGDSMEEVEIRLIWIGWKWSRAVGVEMKR